MTKKNLKEDKMAFLTAKWRDQCMKGLMWEAALYLLPLYEDDNANRELCDQCKGCAHSQTHDRLV